MASIQSNVDWQSTKNTILERNRHMFNNPDMSDICFTCEGSDKTFYAHKYVLGTSSAVFHAMFYGALPEDLPDTNEETLEQFLRFLYTEECTLTANNVVATMYLAKKYKIPSLVEKCVNFRLENLNVENVLDFMVQATDFEEKEIEEQCWEFIECAAREVVASKSFNNISQATLAKLLKRDNLKIPEVELFQAVLKWIDLQCSRKNLKPTGQSRRSVIGKLIYEFRFIAMTQAQFVEHVSKSGLLTADEMILIHEKMAGFDSPALKWKLPKRRQASTISFPRCPYSGISSRWTYNGKPDRLRLRVNKAVYLRGVRLFGDKNESEYQVTFEVEVKEVKKAKVTGKYTTSRRNQDDIPGYDVLLEKPIIVKWNEIVTLSATITGPDSFRCNAGLSSTTLEGITVTFSDSPRPNNGTRVTDGQFHEIILEI